MEISADLIEGDRERLFADWAEPVVFREVAQTYEPETGQLEESFTDWALSAVVSASPSKATRGTAGQHEAFDVSFVVRPEDLPAGASLSTSRVVQGGTVYTIVGTQRSATGVLLELRCRRV